MPVQQYIEAGKIVNTHGVAGEVKIQPWGQGADFLRGFSRFYIDGTPYKVRSSRVHKGCLLALFEGVDTLDGAVLLKNRTVCIDRNDAHLDDGEYFLSDLLGFDALDDATGEKLGAVSDIITLPSNDVYVIKGDREIMVPAVDEFLRSVDLEAGTVRFSLIEGM